MSDGCGSLTTAMRPWSDDIVYMILVDRFHRGAGGAGPEPPFHGGNIAGIREKLDYLSDLGVTALWISPLYQNQKDGYHGYWPIDFEAMDPRFGTFEEFHSLVEECHAREMKVLLDMVLNHAGYDHPMARDAKKRDWFHHSGGMMWMDQKSLEKGSLHGLPDFAQEKPEVARYLIDVSLKWLERTGVDGFRLDAVKHVPATFWKRFSTEVHAKAGPDFLLLGEVFRGVPEYIARYQREDGIDSVFDVPFADTVRSALTRDAEAPGVSLVARVRELRREYRTMLFNEIVRKLFARKPTDMRWFSSIAKAEGAYTRPHRLATFIDNHDLNRFAHEAEPAEERLKLALGLLMTWRGIPVITYGTEIGMKGGTEGTNRAPMDFEANPGLRDWVKGLIRVRRSNPALTRGVQVELSADREVYAFLRDDGRDRVVAAVNNSRRAQTRVLRLPAGAAWEGAWSDALGAVDDGADAGKEGRLEAREGRLKVTIPPRAVRVLSSRSPGASFARPAPD